MLYALLSDINNIGTINQLFPNTSFPASGPSQEWLTENGVAPVLNTLPYDPDTQALETVDPYLQEGVVYTVIVRELTPEEIQAKKDQIAFTNKGTASSLLAETDWVEIPAVTDPTQPVYLTNKTEFDTYRTALRAIAVNPPETPVTNWPTKPTESWVTNPPPEEISE